jgi:DNA polymerase III sliding clamp (beta) subunit (PCNA family)
MKLNKKKLNIVLPQIKAQSNVVMLADNPLFPGSIDFLFQSKSQGIETDYMNRLTCTMCADDDLFGTDTVEMLGKPVVVNIARLRDALKSGGSDPELQDGQVNGIRVLIPPDDIKTSRMGGILESWQKIMQESKMLDSVKFEMPRIDYELMAQTMLPFISQDPVRYSMNGYYVDLGKSEDFINFCATDGRRLSLCKFPCKHRKLGHDGDGGGFIFKPLNLFIPGSAYSKTQWLVNEDVSFIRIQTEDYSIDCGAKPIAGQFPSYSRVLPRKDENPEWINLSAKAARNAFDSIKRLINNSGYLTIKNQVFINAEDPKHIQLTIPGASVDIDGEASRPMCIRCSWDLMKSAFFETPYTKFILQNVDNAIFAEEPRAVWGTSMFITKVIMPIASEADSDKWGIPNTAKAQAVNDKDAKNETDGVIEDLDDEDEVAVTYGDSDVGFEALNENGDSEWDEIGKDD